MKPRPTSHCKRGHDLTGPNLYVRTNGTRYCRACRDMNDEPKRPGTERNSVSRPSDDLIAEAQRRAAAPYRDLAGSFFNDPPVGFSALDRRQSL